MPKSIYQSLAESAKRGEPCALGIITGTKGSSPQRIGAKALFFQDGRIEGTLGGGCLEAEVQQRAIASLPTGKAAQFDLLLDHDFGWDDGLICGGKVFGVILPNAQSAGETFWNELGSRKSTARWGVRGDFTVAKIEEEKRRKGEKEQVANPPWLYQEVVTPPCALWIAGAGHVAQAVAPLAAQIDFQVTIFDDRPALANHQYFPSDVALRVGDWEKMLAEPLPESPTFGLIVTRGHRHDALVLRHWVNQPFVFLGMIGSTRKARIISDHFIEEKVTTTERMQRVACPVGIPIKSQTVPEIAVSILAQFIQKRAEFTSSH